jgi:hypothetical protein
MQRWLPLVIGTMMLVGAGSACATSAHMQQLPVSTPYLCLNCHNVADPTPSTAALNAFGTAFRDNGAKWDRTLALLRSDGDNCTNGFELGDEDGNGQPDVGVTQARSNPGQNDCTLQITPQAWSALKQLFQ